ncbi:MAG: glycosyltransferase [Planctomycetota bacterium]
MKVWHVLHGFPPETAGGTESVVEALARAMQGHGCDVTVVSGSLRVGDPAAVERSDLDGLPVLRLHRDDLYFESWFKAYAPAVSAAFRALLREHRPDVVHVHHWLRLSSDLVRIARAAGCITAVTCHDYFSALARPVRLVGEGAATPPPAPSYVGAAELAEAFAFHRDDFADELRAAHCRFAPSAAQRAGLAQLLPGDVGDFTSIGLPSTVAALRRLPESDPHGSRARRRRLCTWGTLYPEKGLESVLDALARTPAALGWSLDVYGEAHSPTFRDDLLARAAGLRVTWHGRFVPQDLERADVDYAVLPSLADESYGLVLDEALQLGLPVIASDVPAYRERAQGDASVFFPPGDATALAALLAAPARLEALQRPNAPAPLSPARAAADLLSRYRAAAPSPFAPRVTDRERALYLFRRAERRLWSALQQGEAPAPPDEFLAPPPAAGA